MVTAAPRGRPLTWHDLQQFPDDGNRYELIDGELLVSPSPTLMHQRVARRVSLALEPAIPPDHEAFCPTPDWYVSEYTVLLPDVLVARVADLGEQVLPRPPVLAVEVLSPMTWRRDLGLKQLAYAAAGLPWYWVVDPQIPSLRVFHLVGGVHVEVANVEGEAEYTADEPWPLRVRPADLVRSREVTGGGGGRR
jgi:Uma2 family endonuclease